MTLTDVLRRVLDPATSAEGEQALRELSTTIGTNLREVNVGLCASIIRYGRKDNPLFKELIPSIIRHAAEFGMPCVALLDVISVNHRSQKWADAAQQLAEWADSRPTTALVFTTEPETTP